MMNQHAPPTPPSSADVPRLPLPPAGLHPISNMSVRTTLAQTDVLTCHLLSSQGIRSTQLALVAQASHRGAQVGERSIPVYTGHYQAVTAPTGQCSRQGDVQQHSYYDHRPTVTPRNSTSTPSPSQESPSPPSRSGSVESNMSAISAESTSSARSRFGTYSSLYLRGGSTTHSLPPPCHFYPVHPDSQSQAAKQSPKHHTASQSHAARESSTSLQIYPDVSHNRNQFVNDQETYNPCNAAVDLSRPRSKHCESNNTGKQQMDLNHNIVVSRSQPANMNTDSMWRPW